MIELLTAAAKIASVAVTGAFGGWALVISGGILFLYYFMGAGSAR